MAFRISLKSAKRMSSNYEQDWREMTERIGFWVNLDEAYITLSNDYIESVWWVLRQAWDKNLLYQGHKVQPYCYRCGTTLANHEVALGYQEVEDPSIFVRFPVEEQNKTPICLYGQQRRGHYHLMSLSLSVKITIMSPLKMTDNILSLAKNVFPSVFEEGIS